MSHASGGRGQASPVGVILILGLTLTAAVGIAVVGGDAIQGTQSRSEVGQAEQAMTQFDARAAQVALGDSVSQTVSLGGQGGSYRVEEGVGQVRLLHENWNGTDCSECDTDYGSSPSTTNEGNTTILYDQDLGALVYESGDTTVAYQGGGVWRKGDDGTARPVSSPEFHYRGATLTFPLVRVGGSGGGSGQVKANVQRVETAKDVYPDQSGTYPDGETRLTNPVEEGNMTVEVTSEYCEGWRRYFEERTEGDVSECNGDTVEAEIVTLGLQGDFDPTIGSEIEMRGQDDGHTLEDLEFEFKTSQSNSDFGNFEWSMAGSNGDQEIEVYLGRPSGSDPGCGDAIRTVVYYSDDGGDSHHTWILDDAHGSNPVTITCSDGEEILQFDLLDSSREFEYADKDNNELLRHDDNANNFAGSEEFSDHAADPGTSYSAGAREPMSLVVQHYFASMGDMTLHMNEKSHGSSSNLADASSGRISYEGGGNVLTYLHVTENRVEIDLS